MKNFNQGGDRKFGGDRGGRGGDFKKRSFGGDRGGRGGFGGGDRPEMFKATCADCGASCEVPFKPNGNKPVLCSNCFKGSDRSEGRRDDRKFGGRSSFGSDRPEMHKAVCADCGESCEVPFKPSSDKPVYCSNCFKKGDSRPSAPRSESHSHGSSSSKLEERMDAIDAKLDKLMKFINPATQMVKDLEIAPVKIMDNVKKGIKNAKKDVKDITKDAKVIGKEVIKDAKVIKKEISKDVKKVKKEVAKVIKKVIKKVNKK
ncbi:MAG: CxxC-x17-CxxC domain-containing protein [Patescibacteria group bacterium]